MLFRNGEDSLKLDVVHYELPAGTGEPGSDDRNWLTMKAVWRRDGEITVDSNSCLLTYELQELTAGLKVLLAGLKTEYESDFMEPYFSLYASAEREGFPVDVTFYLPNTMDGDDTAEMHSVLSREELRALVEELDRLCGRFPDRK